MKRIVITYIAFFIIRNSDVSCVPNSLTEFLVNFISENSTAALKNVVDIFTTDKLTAIGRSNFSEIVQMFGHKCEEHEVITEDGYILKLYRIPGNVNKTVVLVHGKTESAYAWIHRGENSLSLTLANKGYDVWAINLRGTTESKRHKHLDPVKDSSKFFNYTFYEWGLYDMSATIDYILNKTSQTQLTVITHSQGSSDMYVLGSERPEYNDKVKLSLNLAPVATFHNMRGAADVLRQTIFVVTNGKYSVADTGQEIFGHDQVGLSIQAFCFDPVHTKSCLTSIFGSNKGSKGIEAEFLFTYFGHYPAGTSTKLLNHLYQIMCRKKFSKYDYGMKRNMQLYHSKEPPDFNLSKVTMKTALLIGKNDYFTSLKSVKRIKDGLPNVVYSKVLPYKHFGHLDFVDGRDMAKHLFPFIFGLLEKYSS